MKNRIVYCPECATEIYRYQSNQTIDVVIKCQHCRKYIRFEPQGMRTSVVNKPERMTSSGARFW